MPNRVQPERLSRRECYDGIILKPWTLLRRHPSLRESGSAVTETNLFGVRSDEASDPPHWPARCSFRCSHNWRSRHRRLRVSQNQPRRRDPFRPRTPPGRRRSMAGTTTPSGRRRHGSPSSGSFSRTSMWRHRCERSFRSPTMRAICTSSSACTIRTPTVSCTRSRGAMCAGRPIRSRS